MLCCFGLCWLVGMCASASASHRRTTHTRCRRATHSRGCSNLRLVIDQSHPAGATPQSAPAPSAADPAGAAPGSPTAASSGGGACANAGLAASRSNLPLVSAAVFCLINLDRVAGGLTPLRASARLAGAAQRHSDDMAGSRQFDHQGSAGDSPLDRLRASSYLESGRGFTLGENIAWEARRSTAARMVAAWMASADHRANIMSADFRDTGIGLAPAPASAFSSGAPGMTVTEDFAALT